MMFNYKEPYPMGGTDGDPVDRSVFDSVKRFKAQGMTDLEAISEVERVLRAPLPQFIKDKCMEEASKGR